MSRLVFITGASSGIGQALALRFYAAGDRLGLAGPRTAKGPSPAAGNAPDAGREYPAGRRPRKTAEPAPGQCRWKRL